MLYWQTVAVRWSQCQLLHVFFGVHLQLDFLLLELVVFHVLDGKC